ncbi:MAG: transporter substrate-binding domain-containing protein [Caldilineaceae bacterium]
MKSVFSWRRNWLLSALIAAALIILIAVLWQRDVINFAGVDRTWLAIQERGTWRVGMDPSFPPFELLDDDGAPVGFDVDLAHALAAELSVDVEIVTLGFDGLIDAVQVGRIDSVINAPPRSAADPGRPLHHAYFEAGTPGCACRIADHRDRGSGGSARSRGVGQHGRRRRAPDPA